HRPVKRAIDYYTKRALVRLMFRNKKHRPPKVRVDHVRMGNQQRTGKIARHPFITQITHPKLETPTRDCATSRSGWHSTSCLVCRAVIHCGPCNGRTLRNFVENFV